MDGFVPCERQRGDGEVCGDLVPCSREGYAVAGVVEGAGACEAGLDRAANFWPERDFSIIWRRLRLFWDEEVEDAKGDVFAVRIGFVGVVGGRASDDDLLGYLLYFDAVFALIYEAGD